METIIYRPVELPCDIAEKVEHLLRRPDTAAARVCELIEQIDARFPDEFFSYAGTVAQSLTPEICEQFRKEAKKALQNERDSLQERVRLLYSVM